MSRPSIKFVKDTAIATLTAVTIVALYFRTRPPAPIAYADPPLLQRTLPQARFDSASAQTLIQSLADSTGLQLTLEPTPSGPQSEWARNLLANDPTPPAQTFHDITVRKMLSLARDRLRHFDLAYRIENDHLILRMYANEFALHTVPPPGMFEPHIHDVSDLLQSARKLRESIDGHPINEAARRQYRGGGGTGLFGNDSSRPPNLDNCTDEREALANLLEQISQPGFEQRTYLGDKLYLRTTPPDHQRIILFLQHLRSLQSSN